MATAQVAGKRKSEDDYSSTEGADSDGGGQESKRTKHDKVRQ